MQNLLCRCFFAVLCGESVSVTALFDQYLLLAIMLFGTFSFIALFFVNAPYGKFHDGFKDAIFSINGRLAWFIQESASPIAFAYTLYFNAEDVQKLPLHVIVAATCFLIHYIHRAFIYTFLCASMSDSKIYIMFMALGFTSANGYLNAKLLLFQSEAPSLVLLLVGAAIWFYGIYTNISSDYHLIALRKQRSKDATKEYFLPTKGLFQYVSAANYVGEMIEWIGYALMAQNCAATCFAIFTPMNLAPRCFATHKFYQEKFKDKLPKSRKALIPFLL